MTAYEKLIQLRDYGPKDPYYGICSVVGQNIIQGYFKEWSEYSGNRLYPVPHPDLNPQDAYNGASSREMWSPNHPYGAARLRLLDFLIERNAP